jgi:hypothetical protein
MDVNIGDNDKTEEGEEGEEIEDFGGDGGGGRVYISGLLS